MADESGVACGGGTDADAADEDGFPVPVVNQELPLEQRSLFEYLGAADLERIHTQTIAWMLHAPESPLTVQERRNLLEAFGIVCDHTHNFTVAYVELKRLDLIICTNDEVVLVVENKLKSQLSLMQLEQYNEILETLPALLGREMHEGAVKALLSLSGEQPGLDWVAVNYSAVVGGLPEIHQNPYVQGYIDLVKRLVLAKNAFLDDHANPNFPDASVFEQVYDQVAVPTLVLLNAPPPPLANLWARFICVNRLERIMVQTLLRLLVPPLGRALVEAGAQGRPLVQVILFFVQLVPKAGQSTRWYRAGVQFQGEAQKLNMADVRYPNANATGILIGFDPYFLPRRPNAAHGNNEYRSWSVRPNNPEFAMGFRTLHTAAMQARFVDQTMNAHAMWQAALAAFQAAYPGVVLQILPWDEDAEQAVMAEARAP